MFIRKLPRWHYWRSSGLPGNNHRWLRTRGLVILLILLLAESLYHVYNLRVHRPADFQESDRPFQYGCTLPKLAEPRANATILMLARNSDISDALHTIQSLERHFNRWFNYPVLFLNNEPWEIQFIEALTNATSGQATFDTIPKHMWAFPDWMDPEEARASMRRQKNNLVMHGGEESYHHMCRFYSGMFYDVPAVQKYRWYWRVEPNVDFACSITYDPFREMEKRGKRYGYTIAIEEERRTVPSLFGLVDQYKEQHRLGTEIWKAMLDASWLPWPFRKLLQHFPHHTTDGDSWNLCHYWSNFEIADLEFFRSQEYRDFFNFLDRSGGFYFERFGDAPVHSLAAALFLKPQEIHYFEDFGYRHDKFWVQPNNALNRQIPSVNISDAPWTEEVEGASGCRCEKNDRKISGKVTNIEQTCLQRLGEAIKDR